jgi:hypothetical protein
MRCLLRFTHSLGAVVRQGGIRGAHTGKRADGVKAYVDAMLKAIQVLLAQARRGVCFHAMVSTFGACAAALAGFSLRFACGCSGLCARACVRSCVCAREIPYLHYSRLYVDPQIPMIVLMSTQTVDSDRHRMTLVWTHRIARHNRLSSASCRRGHMPSHPMPRRRICDAFVPCRIARRVGRHQMRKPKTGMFEYFKMHYARELDVASSFYVGDAAGRVGVRQRKLAETSFCPAETCGLARRNHE